MARFVSQFDDLVDRSRPGTDLAIGGTSEDDPIDGTADGDKIHGLAGDDTLNGLGGSDLLKGGVGNDLLDGGASSDEIYGGMGLDTLKGDTGNDFLDGGQGDDSLSGGSGDDQLVGGKGDDLLDGGDGIDSVTYIDAKGALVIDLAAQTATGFGSDTLVSIEGATGGWGDDLIIAGDGGSRLGGFVGEDTLEGASGDDWLFGSNGRDEIVGGAGQDTLIGGNGKDAFVFTSVADSAPGAADSITDLSKGDVIDLSAIDADSMQGGDQAFTVVSQLDGHAGELAVAYDSGSDTTTVGADVDGDGNADMAISIVGDTRSFMHFVL